MSGALATLLMKRGTLVSAPLIQAFTEISREAFLPLDLRELAEADTALPIGYGQTVSQPSTVAVMLELLEAEAGQTVLDVGSGSGWTSALLGSVVGEKGRVIALERIPELCQTTRENIEKFGLGRAGVVQCFCENGSAGYPSWAPYDRILVSAAGEKIPEALKSQLSVGGRLVMPIRQSVIRLSKKNENDFQEEEFPGFVFVPFIEK